MLNRLQTVFECLHSREVRYVVIGGIAAVLHGVPRMTFDLDLLIDPEIDNARRLLQAFDAAGLGTASLTTPEQLLEQEITIFNDLVRIDVQTRTPGITFSEAWSTRVTTDFQGTTIHLVSREMLIASKTAAARPKDLEDVRILQLPGGDGPKPI